MSKATDFETTAYMSTPWVVDITKGMICQDGQRTISPPLSGTE